MTKKKRRGELVEAGRFYARVTPDGPLLPAPASAPDVWICRRVADFPNRALPVGAAEACCDRCGAAIAYNPGRVAAVPAATPKHCMQCCGIEPLPID